MGQPTDFTQKSVTTLGGLLPNTQIYFNEGKNKNNSGPITLDPAQSLQSRTADFSQPATGVARTITIGTITLPGNNTLENIILIPSAGTTDGIIISGANNVITGSQIGSSNNPYSLGVRDLGSTNTLINNSSIFASSRGYLGGGNTITIENSAINVNVLPSGVGEGISFSSPFSDLTVNNTQIVVNNASVSSDTFGIFVPPSNTVTVNNSSVSVTSLLPMQAILLALTL